MTLTNACDGLLILDARGICEASSPSVYSAPLGISLFGTTSKTKELVLFDSFGTTRNPVQINFLHSSYIINE